MKIIRAKDVEEIKKRFRCGACDGAKCEHTLGCQALTELLSLAKEVDEKVILGALARGYCDKETEKEVMNPTLCKIQTQEILKVLEKK